MGVVVKISHRLGIKEYQGRTPHVSPKRVLDLDEVSLSPPQTSEGRMSYSTTAAPRRRDGVGRWRRLVAGVVGGTAVWLAVSKAAGVVGHQGGGTARVGARCGRSTKGTLEDLWARWRAQRFDRRNGCRLGLGCYDGWGTGGSGLDLKISSVPGAGHRGL